MAEFKVELTEQEQKKYDLTYKSIISNYTKKDLIILDDDPIAKFYLHNLVLKYVMTGEFPTNTDITNNIHLLSESELTQNYDATIPLQENKETLISNIKEEDNE